MSKSMYWVAINLFGIGLFLYVASWAWVAHGQESLQPRPGSFLLWLFFVIPGLLLFFFLDLFWALSLIRLRRTTPVSAGAAWLVLIVVLWTAALVYDGTRHQPLFSLTSVVLRANVFASLPMPSIGVPTMLWVRCQTGLAREHQT